MIWTLSPCVKMVGCKHRVGPAHLLATLVTAHLWACLLKPTKSALWFNAKPSMHGKVWLILIRSDGKFPKSACLSLYSDLGAWDTLKKKKRKKQRPFGLVGSKGRNREPKHTSESFSLKQESHSAIVRDTSESFSLRRCSPCKEIERNIVRVWESEKEKWHIFLYSSYTQRR